MPTYLGFYTPDPAFAAANGQSGRSGGGPNSAFLDKVRALRSALPEGTTIIGSYATLSVERSNVMIVESPDVGGLVAINQYYNGYLEFDWCPANAIGGSQEETDEWRQVRAADR